MLSRPHRLLNIMSSPLTCRVSHVLASNPLFFILVLLPLPVQSIPRRDRLAFVPFQSSNKVKRAQ